MKSNGSAVDEGRNPYGKPGQHGNYSEAWKKLSDLPCPRCGSKLKTLTIDQQAGTIKVVCTNAKATD